MKISQQLRSAAIGIFVVGSSSLVSVYLNSLGNDSKVVNYTGIVRGGSQRAIKLELAGRPNNLLIEKQDKLIDALINGSVQMGLPPATDPEFRSQMQQVATAWQDLKLKIEATRKNNQMRDELLEASEGYFELADLAVSAAEKYTRGKAERIAAIQLAVFASSLLLLIGIWITVDKITKILKQSTHNIATSFDRISTVVNEQEQCVMQQSLSAGKAIDLIGGIKELTQQSTATIQLSVDRFPRVTESLHKTHQGSDLSFKIIAELREQLQAIVNDLDLLDRQVLKFTQEVAPAQTLATTAARGAKLPQANTGSRFNRGINSADDFERLLANLRASIATIKTTANDSVQMADNQVTISKDITHALWQMLSTLDAISLNNQQMLTTSKQYASVVQQVSSLIERLNMGANDTTASIAQIRASASELGETTVALQSRI